MPSKLRSRSPSPLRLVTLLVALLPGAAPAAPGDDCAGFSIEAALAAVNAARRAGAVCGAHGGQAGAVALVWNDRLAAVAVEQAAWLAERGALQHGGRNGQTLAQRSTAAGYDYARITENLAAGPQALPQLLAAWTASEGHCVNLYDSGVTQMALACVPGAGGRPFWALVLGRPL